MFQKIKRIVLGRSLKSDELDHEKFSVLWGLPILSSDAISSVSYACEEILMVLIPVLGLASYRPLMGVAFAIICLLMILVFSYRQTISAYPQGGGSYIVTSENLGKTAGLVAASSLAIDYVLTVAVSICAGTAAITSAFPSLLPYKTLIAFVMVSLLAIGNLRGMRESSILFGLPTYMFMISILIMIITGIIKVLVLKEIPPVSADLHQPTQDLTLVLFLKAFSSGCTALTGVEAVSDGIPNFKAPAQKNAKRVLTLLACIVFMIFVGVCFLATMYHVVPNENVTAIAQISSHVFGNDTLMFYIVQATTAIILTMAANTAFADLPLLFSILAKDGYVPRQFMARGSRLSFSNGIIMLFLLSASLVMIFHANTHHLMPLYAVGVFLSFTLSQAGMFVRWLKTKEGKWKHKAFINGLGTIITAITCMIIAASKFFHGAWIVLLCIPVFVFVMRKIHQHYEQVKHDLDITEINDSLIRKQPIPTRIILPVDSINRSFIKAVNYAYTLHCDNMEIYHVDVDAYATQKLQHKYGCLQLDIPLCCEQAPYRNINETLLHHIEEEAKHLLPQQTLTIIIPQFVVTHVQKNILHNQTSLLLKHKLSYMRNVSIISVPYVLHE